MMSNKKETQNQREELVTYRVTAEPRTTEDGVNYTAFGIAAMSGEETLASVADISASREEVESLAERCTRNRLAPEQLRDVVEDYIVAAAL